MSDQQKPATAEQFARAVDWAVCAARHEGVDAADMIPALTRAAREASITAEGEHGTREDHYVVDPRDGTVGLAGDIDEAEEHLSADEDDVEDVGGRR